MAKFKVYETAPSETTSEGAVVVVEAKSVGVSNGALYLMNENGNVAVFAREYWYKVERVTDE